MDLSRWMGWVLAAMDNPERLEMVYSGRSDDGGVDGVDSDDEYEIRFFRYKNRLIFDSSDDDAEMLGQEDIDHMMGRPREWVDKGVKKCIYIVSRSSLHSHIHDLLVSINLSPCTIYMYISNE